MNVSLRTTKCDTVFGFRKRLRVRPPQCLTPSLVSTSPRCPSSFLPDNDVHAPLLQKKTEKGNFIEMAEAATTIKGLRAQMGKKNLVSRRYLWPHLCRTTSRSLLQLVLTTVAA